MHEVEQQLLQIKWRLQPPPAASEGEPMCLAVQCRIAALERLLPQQLVVAAAVLGACIIIALCCTASV
jgi:hypothetical protein